MLLFILSQQESLALRDKISQELSNVEEKCDVSSMGELEAADREALSRRTREILHQCYKFGFEVGKKCCIKLKTHTVLPNFAFSTTRSSIA